MVVNRSYRLSFDNDPRVKYNAIMEREKLVRRELPEVGTPEYMPALIKACIEAFKAFGHNGTALDFVGVDGKLRPMVLENENYRKATRQIRADKLLVEIEEIEGISKQLKSEEPKQTGYDMRNPKDADNYTKDIKETLSLRLKVADARRELLNISKEEEVEENDALNVFFIALTKEEFDAMDNVEIHEGTDNTKIDDSVKVGPQSAKKKYGLDVDDEPDPFFIAADGSIEEIMPQ